jgi:hypothetical protein
MLWIKLVVLMDEIFAFIGENSCLMDVKGHIMDEVFAFIWMKNG